MLNELYSKFYDEISKALVRDAAYRKAEEKLNAFLKQELPADKLEAAENLISILTDEIERASAQSGMKFGAEIIKALDEK